MTAQITRPIFLITCIFSCCVSTVSADDWKLIWKDEFDGQTLNYSQWETEINAFGGGNHEQQIYTDRPRNVRIKDGHLVIEAHNDHAEVMGTSRPFSSGKIRSKHRGDWKYGRFEVRAKLPGSPGIWPAIWMMPTENRYGEWARSGEIDIMEFKGQEPYTIWGTLHHGKRWPDNTHTGKTLTTPEIDYTQDFHVYTLEWEEAEIRWYVDGKLWQTQTKWSTPAADFPAPFDQKFHMVLNVAVAGQFVGPTNSETKFPAAMLVDYVRVYQRTESK